MSSLMELYRIQLLIKYKLKAKVECFMILKIHHSIFIKVQG